MKRSTWYILIFQKHSTTSITHCWLQNWRRSQCRSHSTILSFICQRTYVLKVDGNVTKFGFMSTSGVPQGSHCGPLLYLLMCRDLVLCVLDTGAFILLYADDTKIFRIINSDDDMQLMQKAIDNLVR